MTGASEDDRLGWLVAEVLRSRKHAGLLPAFVASVGRRELALRGERRAALRATKRRLHQMVGAYRGVHAYRGALEALARAQQGGDLRPACLELMRWHASSRERIRMLDRVYAEVLSGIGPVQSVLDLACGLHPLGIPWMPLAPGATYYACDVDLALLDFLSGFFDLAGVRGRAFACDLLNECPGQEVELAFLLKSLPCLEQLDRSAAGRLLAGVRARHLVVSFPVASLGGRPRGMRSAYERRFRELVAGRAWRVERFSLAGELLFRVEK